MIGLVALDHLAQCVHIEFMLSTPDEVDAELKGWIKEAYEKICLERMKQGLMIFILLVL